MTNTQSMQPAVKYSSGLAITVFLASTSKYALGLLATYYGLRQMRKLGQLMS